MEFETEELKALAASGRERGYLTFDAVAEAVAELDINRGQVEELNSWLTEQGIGEIVVSGIRTEQCCETTTRHASDLGWKVVFVPEATLTFDMALPDGTPFRAADIVARTASVLQGRFARVMNVEETLAHVVRGD